VNVNVSVSEDKVTAELTEIKRRHREDPNSLFPVPGICFSRCPGKWPCEAHRAASALEAALESHHPEQLHALVEDYHGKVVCPHGGEYDGDLHYEADDGWHCREMPTVVVCSSCCDPDDDTLRAPWPCRTRADIARELGVEP
jgi:hypothetical protein